MFHTPNQEVLRFSEINDQLAMVIVKKNKTFPKPVPNTSLIIGIFTTSHARLALQKGLNAIMEMPNATLLYCDT